MLTRTIFTLLFAAAFTPARAAIELPPVPHEATEEGFTYKQLLFKDGKRQVVYQMPPQWTYRPREGGAQLVPPNAEFVEALILAAPRPALNPLDEKGMEEAKQELVHNLPQGSQLVSIVSEERNPVLLNNKPSYEVIVTYQLMGEKFVRSALLTNFTDMQVSFRLTARKIDFERLHQAFRLSILSWHWVEPAATGTGPVTASN